MTTEEKKLAALADIFGAAIPGENVLDMANRIAKHAETIRTLLQPSPVDAPIVVGTREAIIDAVEQEMGYYDIPEAEPNITFTGQTVCDLVDLAKTLMNENLELEQSCHDRQLEIYKLQCAAPVDAEVREAETKLEIIKQVLFKAASDMRRQAPHWHNVFLSVAAQKIEEVQHLMSKMSHSNDETMQEIELKSRATDTPSLDEAISWFSEYAWGSKPIDKDVLKRMDVYKNLIIRAATKNMGDAVTREGKISRYGEMKGRHRRLQAIAACEDRNAIAKLMEKDFGLSYLTSLDYVDGIQKHATYPKSREGLVEALEWIKEYVTGEAINKTQADILFTSKDFTAKTVWAIKDDKVEHVIQQIRFNVEAALSEHRKNMEDKK